MKKIIYIIIGIVLTIGCTERIDIDLGTTYNRLVVEGHITTDSNTQWIRLSESTDYYGENPSNKISDAIVTVDDGFETVTFTEDEGDTGLYNPPENFIGVEGRTYNLNIELKEEIAGQKNYSAECELRPVAPIDSIQVVYNPDWEGWEVKLFALDPPSVDFYQFLVLKNDTLMTDTINKISISDDRFFNGNYTFGITVAFLWQEYDREVVRPGDVITLKMGGITKEYFNFIVELQDQTFEYRNPLFSGPPANVSTNISNGASGFFAAYSLSSSSTIFIE